MEEVLKEMITFGRQEYAVKLSGSITTSMRTTEQKYLMKKKLAARKS